MDIVRLVAGIVDLLLTVYIVVLFARLVLEYIPIFNREWRPRGGMLIVAEIIYTVTDPPVKFFRRLVPPLRIGPVALDLGFPLTLLACFLLQTIVRIIALS